MAVTADTYFSDFDWSFTPHPKTGDVTILKDDLAVKRSIKNIVLTKYTERRFYSGKGCGVHFYLFELLDSISKDVIESEIRTAVKNEPRAEILDVKVFEDSEETGLFISIYFKIINSTTIDTVTIFLERTR